MSSVQTVKSSPDLVAQTIQKMTKAEKREILLTTFGNYDEGPKTLFLSTKRRQRFQRLMIVHRPELRGNHIMDMECEMTLLGKDIAQSLRNLKD